VVYGDNGIRRKVPMQTPRDNGNPGENLRPNAAPGFVSNDVACAARDTSFIIIIIIGVVVVVVISVGIRREAFQTGPQPQRWAHGLLQRRRCSHPVPGAELVPVIDFWRKHTTADSSEPRSQFH
jgi:hypothetical protein